MINKLKVTLTIGIFGIGIALLAYALLIPNVSSSIDRFEAIPQKPSDFSAYTREVWSGGLTDLCEIEEDYWLQPGFYGDSWEIAKEKFYDNPDYSRWGVYGQGSIPSGVGYTLEEFHKGDTFTVCSFFHNGFGIWTYQGFKLVASESEYFNVEVVPNQFTLTPTFPVFEDGWTRRIEVKITAKEEVPKGEYQIELNAISPDQKYSIQQNKDVLKMEIDKAKYKDECVRFLNDEDRCEKLINLREKKYVEGGTYRPDKSPLTISLKII